MSEIVIAPFSNNSLRDWPIGHFVSAIDLLLDQVGGGWTVSLIGAPGQRLAAHEIVRTFPAARVRNECGRLSWAGMTDRVRAADCVIGNNSGITHLSREMGVPTVCIFGGSHQRTEWGPMGDNAVIVSRAIGCSPCHLYRIAECPYGAACLHDIAPSVVVDAALMIMARVTKGGRCEPHALAAGGDR